MRAADSSIFDAKYKTLTQASHGFTCVNFFLSSRTLCVRSHPSQGTGGRERGTHFRYRRLKYTVAVAMTFLLNRSLVPSLHNTGQGVRK